MTTSNCQNLIGWEHHLALLSWCSRHSKKFLPNHKPTFSLYSLLTLFVLAAPLSLPHFSPLSISDLSSVDSNGFPRPSFYCPFHLLQAHSGTQQQELWFEISLLFHYWKAFSIHQFLTWALPSFLCGQTGDYH